MDHRLFAGAMSKQRLSLVERALVKGVKAPYGDFRDWNAIESWAASIAKQINSGPMAETAASVSRGE